MTIEDIRTAINNAIYTNGQNLISASTMNTLLNMLATYTNDTGIDIDSSIPGRVLRFDGIIDDVYNIQTGNPWNGNILYSRKKDAFVMRQTGTTSELSYQSYSFLVDDITSVGTYNTLSDGVFTANRGNLYVDNDGNIYAFKNEVFTKVVEGGKRFTTHSLVNKAVKELYLNTEDYSELYVSWIVHKYEEYDANQDKTLVKCQFQIRNSSGIVCQYGDYITEEHTPPTLIELKEANSSGISGYAVLDWNAITENVRWFGTSTDGYAYLTDMAVDMAFSPSVKAYLAENSVQYTEQALTAEQQAQARTNIDAQKSIAVEVKDNGNIVLTNLRGESKEFMPATPSGDPMHNMYEKGGAVWNNETGYWELNELTDLTTKDIKQCYTQCFLGGIGGFYIYPTQFYENKFRTNFVNINSTYGAQNNNSPAFNMFNSCCDTEVLNIASIVVGTSASHMFYKCTKLKKILGVLRLTTSTVAHLNNIFGKCASLEYVNINALSTSISFAESPALSNESILYMIQNARTYEIVITLHPDAYARATVDEDIQAALEEHTNITLASA